MVVQGFSSPSLQGHRSPAGLCLAPCVVKALATARGCAGQGVLWEGARSAALPSPPCPAPQAGVGGTWRWLFFPAR